MIYLFGSNGFIGKNLYLHLKKNKQQITLLNRNASSLHFITDTDILINCTGVNRCDTYEEYEKGNFLFMKTVISNLHTHPFLIHLSSFMLNNPTITCNEWFITSKLKCEQYLTENYPKEKLCILRPSNIYGYNCEPYYNNILCTLVYEKITNQKKVTIINKNATRNFLSIGRLCQSISDLILTPNPGTYSILSTNTLNLHDLVKIIHNQTLPPHLTITDGPIDHITESTTKSIIIAENIQTNIANLEQDTKTYIALKNAIPKQKLTQLTQQRGDMTEIVNNNFKRLYKISVNQSQIRGEHYHEIQTEQFFINKGTILFLLAFPTQKNVVLIVKSNENDIIQIPPNVIHTVCNDYLNNENEIFITSTQEFIKDSTPDTFYIGILN